MNNPEYSDNYQETADNNKIAADFQESWLKRNINKLILGAAAVGFAISIPQTVDSVKENAAWAVPGLILSEAAWNIGAACMLLSAGKEIGNPLTMKNRIKEAKADLHDNKLFRTGLGVNLVGATGTAAILSVGSVATLPATTWPGAILVAGVSAAPSFALWKGVYGDKNKLPSEDAQ
jgi:hypothetical protein